MDFMLRRGVRLERRLPSWLFDFLPNDLRLRLLINVLLCLFPIFGSIDLFVLDFLGILNPFVFVIMTDYASRNVLSMFCMDRCLGLAKMAAVLFSAAITMSTAALVKVCSSCTVMYSVALA